MNIMNPPADWSTLKKLIWLRGTPITGGEELTVSGTPPLSLPNSLGKPLKAWEVELSPYQDLHGYDNPWPVGGGENKINYLSCVGVGARNGTDSVYGNNTSISGTELTINQAYGDNGGILKGVGTFPLSTGEYVTISGKATLTGTSYLVVGISNYDGGGTNNINANVTVTNGRFSVKLDAKSDYAKTGIFLQPQTARSTAVVSDVMVALGQTEQPYSPYSNICPILGTDKVTVWTSGKNLCPYAEWSNNPDRLWGSSFGNLVTFLNTLPIGTYTISNKYSVASLPSGGKVQHGPVFIRATVNGTTVNVSNYSTVTDNDPSVGKVYEESVSFTITDAIKGNITNAYLYCDSGDTHTGDATVRGSYNCYNIQIEVGNQATPYTPFLAPSQTVITIPQTVYNGTAGSEEGESRFKKIKLSDIPSSNWDTSSAPENGVFRAVLNPTAEGTESSVKTNAISDQLKAVAYAPISANDYACFAIDGFRSLLIVTTGRTITSVADFLEQWGDIEVCYPLATPTTFAVPSSTIPTPTGTATTWATAEDGIVDSMEVTYVGKA